MSPVSPDAMRPHPGVHDTLGAALLGICGGFCLFGLIIGQAAHYMRSYSSDPLHMKILVAVLTLMECVHTVLMADVARNYLVTEHGNPEALSEGTLSMILVIPTAGIIILSSDYFYARRLYLLVSSRFRRTIVLVTAAYILTIVGLAMPALVFFFLDPSYDSWLKYRWTLSSGLGVSAVGDILVAIGLMIHLYKQRTGFKRTDKLIDTLNAYAFNTGLVTSLSSLFCMILSIVEGDNFFVISVSIVITKVYAISVLFTLNSRKKLAHQLTAPINLDSEWVGFGALEETEKSQQSSETSTQTRVEETKLEDIEIGETECSSSTSIV